MPSIAGAFFAWGNMIKREPLEPSCPSSSRMHAATTTSITRALSAVNGKDKASVRPITDALNANGFNCDVDEAAGGAFLGLEEGHLVAVHLNVKQRATVCAAQRGVTTQAVNSSRGGKRRRVHDGGCPRRRE